MQLTIPACKYDPHRFQKRAHASGKRFLLLAAGVRGGKTYSGVVEFARRIGLDLAKGKARPVSGYGGKRRRASLHYWITAPTRDLLKESWRYVFETIPHEMIEQRYEAEQMLWLKGNVLIEAKSADNPLHLVSAGLDGLFIDEAARVKADAWQGQLRQRLTDHQGWGIFATTPLGRNWVYEDLYKKSGADQEYEAISWHTADNPAIPAEEIESAKRQLPRRYFEREYLASFDAFLGNIWDEFDEKVHVTSERELLLEYGLSAAGRPLTSIFKRIVGGIDWGWSSPGCILIVGDTGRELIVLEESYAPHRFVSSGRDGVTWVSEAKRLAAKWGQHTAISFHADPSRPGDIFDLTRNGVHCMGADNDITWGIRKVAEAMHIQSDGKPRLRVMSTCANLIREIKSYVFAEAKGADAFKEEPAPDQSDHSADALRYSVVELTRYWSQMDERPQTGGAYAYGPIS